MLKKDMTHWIKRIRKRKKEKKTITCRRNVYTVTTNKVTERNDDDKEIRGKYGITTNPYWSNISFMKYFHVKKTLTSFKNKNKQIKSFLKNG